MSVAVVYESTLSLYSGSLPILVGIYIGSKQDVVAEQIDAEHQQAKAN